MSEKNFVAYGDAESILTGYANRIKQSPTTFVGTQAQWNALSSSQKAEYELVDITDDSLSPSGHVDWESNGKIGSKNLLPNKATTQTINGVTFTINSDGSVTANGTATSNAEIDIATNVPLNGNYILSDDFAGINGQYWAFANVDNGARQYILTSKEMPITISNKLDYFRVKVFSGVTANNITFKPMIRLATDSDSTYQPYAMTNKELTKQVSPIDDMNNILGAKNLLPVTMVSQVLSGVTFTVDASSGVISVSGSNSGSPFSDVLGITTLTPGTYKVTTGQATELNAQIGIAVTNASSGTILARSWNGTEVFTISSDTQVNFHIEVNVTGAITSTTIYPTCKLDSIKDESYVPYAMTNRQLTDGLNDIHSEMSDLIIIESASKTITGNGQTYREQTYNVNKSGYTFLGVGGWSVGNVAYNMNCQKKNGNLYVMAYYLPGSAWSGTLSFGVELIYRKNI